MKVIEKKETAQMNKSPWMLLSPSKDSALIMKILMTIVMKIGMICRHNLKVLLTVWLKSRKELSSLKYSQYLEELQ